MNLPSSRLLLPAMLLAAGVANLAAAAEHDSAGEAMTRDLRVCPKPVWPAAALARDAAGQTTVAVRVDTAGRVTDSRIDVSSGHADLDEAARQGIGRCRFHSLAAALGKASDWKPMQYVWYVVKTDKATSAPVTPERVSANLALAEGGDAEAQFQAGRWYQYGAGGTVDPVQAEAWYRRAAEAGNAAAQQHLARLYLKDGRQEEALQWLRQAARAGHADAQADLGWMYRFGMGVAADDAEALYWLTQAASGGSALHQMRLGYWLQQQAGSKAGMDAERASAVGWLAKAAAGGDPYGQLYLARSHELGNGIGQDEGHAVALYRGTLGRTGGQGEVSLGAMLEEGRGAPADAAAAARLYKAAMDVAYGPAFQRYGRLLETGTGVPRDEKLAVQAYLQGADLGDCEAMNRLGKLYLAREALRPTGYEWLGRAIHCEVMRDARSAGR